MKIILGSSSPRRKYLLSLLIDTFDILIPQCDESALVDERPVDYCERISEEKARSLKLYFSDNSLIISADTIVTIDQKILGKPISYEHAYDMLTLLSGRTHHVITSMSLYYTICGKESLYRTSTYTEVEFKNLSSDTIQTYLQSTNYKDKAGSYAIQEQGDKLITNIRGSQSNVVGFPVGTFMTNLRYCNIFDSFFGFE